MPNGRFGSVLEGIPAIVLFGPLMFPIAKQVGVHELHYAMVVQRMVLSNRSPESAYEEVTNRYNDALAKTR